jgi:hypothetical protein
MKAAWYERQGPAREVLIVGDLPDPTPAPGEVRIRIAASRVNPGDVKKRQDAFGYGIPYPRVIPHSDGAGRIDQLGVGVSSDWMGRSVWCYGAQSYRPFGNCRGVHGRSCGAGGSATRPRVTGTGRLSWHSRHHRAPCGPRRRSREQPRRVGARRGRCRGPVRRATGTSRGRTRDRNAAISC